MPKFRSRFDDHIRFVREINTPSLTQQCFKDECDINEIVKRPNQGINPFARPTVQATFGDFTQVKDFQESMNIITKATQDFEALPSKIREKFNNEPMKFLEFVNNPNNIKEGVELGIYEKTALEKISSSSSTKIGLNEPTQTVSPLNQATVSDSSAQ